MTSTYAADIVVLGAGPAGLACTYAAASRGQRVILVDRKDDPTQLHSGIAGVLHDASMPFEFDERSIQLGPDLELDLSGRITKRLQRVIIATRAGETEFQHSRPIQYFSDLSQINRLYWERLQEIDTARLMTGCTFGEVFQSNSNHLDAIDVRKSSTQLHIRGDKFVVADGINSTILRRIGLQRRSFGYGVVISKWMDRPCGEAFENDSMSLYAGEPFLENPRSLGMVIPFADRVQFSTLTHVNAKNNGHNLGQEFERFLRYLSGRTHSNIQKSSTGNLVNFHPPLSSSLISKNCFALGDAAWAVEIYFRGAVETGQRLGQALADAAHRNSQEPILAYDKWFSSISRSHGPKELRGFLLLAELGDEGNALFRLLDTIAGRHYGPFRVAPSFRMLGSILLGFIKRPIELSRVINTHQTLQRIAGTWVDTPIMAERSNS